MVKKLVKLGAMVVIGFAVLVVTPYFLFREAVADKFEYGEAEMRAAVEGTWRIDLVSAEGQARTISFTIQQATAAGTKHSSRERGWIRQASACSHRGFIKSAEACIDVSEMALKVTVSGDGGARTSGTLRVMGRSFRQAQLSLQLGDASIDAEISKTGEVKGASYERAARLVRVQPAPRS
jgi:hypothetical protein